MDAQEQQHNLAVPGANLAWFAYGPRPGPGAPCILFIHGYPDDHTVFRTAIAELSADHPVIAYDTRNAGRSHAISDTRAAYRLPLLVDDLFAVIDAAAAGPVHLVGHDWGSIQGWAAIQDPRAQGRILSFISISGPDLGHLRRWFRSRLRRPALWAQAAGQAVRSSYVAAFQLPVLPELAWRLFLTRGYERLTGRTIGDNGARGLALYRTNLFSRRRFPACTALPVQVLVLRRDPFVGPRLVDGLQSWVEDLTIVEVDGGHWWPARQGILLAQVVRSWIARKVSGP